MKAKSSANEPQISITEFCRPLTFIQGETERFYLTMGQTQRQVMLVQNAGQFISSVYVSYLQCAKGTYDVYGVSCRFHTKYTDAIGESRSFRRVPKNATNKKSTAWTNWPVCTMVRKQRECCIYRHK